MPTDKAHSRFQESSVYHGTHLTVLDTEESMAAAGADHEQLESQASGLVSRIRKAKALLRKYGHVLPGAGGATGPALPVSRIRSLSR